MTRDEIKKALYKEKPKAYHLDDDGRNINYACTIKGGEDITEEQELFFSIPREEASEEIQYSEELPAQLLIRWLND